MKLKCSKCKEELDVSNFHKHSGSSRGYQYQCKECREPQKDRAAYLRAWRKKNPNRKKGTGNRKANDSRYKTKNKHKIKAQNALYRAMQKGVVVREPCMVCGEDKVHGHHHDYNKPLDVMWLCVEHHKLIHYEKETA